MTDPDIPLLLEHAVFKAKPFILARQISLRRWDQVSRPILCNPLAQRRLADPQMGCNPITQNPLFSAVRTASCLNSSECLIISSVSCCELKTLR